MVYKTMESSYNQGVITVLLVSTWLTRSVGGGTTWLAPNRSEWIWRNGKERGSRLMLEEGEGRGRKGTSVRLKGRVDASHPFRISQQQDLFLIIYSGFFSAPSAIKTAITSWRLNPLSMNNNQNVDKNILQSLLLNKRISSKFFQI